ncbi:MAG: hypothetical protein MJ084_05570 [Saccharofermentans sp.]|nr:hypothetical protein [Saccharofermentans sp.]
MFATKTRQILMWIVNALSILGLGSFIIFVVSADFWSLLFFAWVFIIFGLLTAGAITAGILLSVSISKMISGKKRFSSKQLVFQTVSTIAALLCSMICFSFLLIKIEKYDLWLVSVAVYSNVAFVYLIFSIISNTQLMRKINAEKAALAEAAKMSEVTPLQSLLNMAAEQNIPIPVQQYAPLQPVNPDQQYMPAQQSVPAAQYAPVQQYAPAQQPQQPMQCTPAPMQLPVQQFITAPAAPAAQTN